MADLETLANYAEIFGAITVVGGFVFAIFQLRALRQQRKDSAAVASVMSFIQGPELSAYVRTISTKSSQEIIDTVDGDGELREAVDAVNAMAEGLGMMVYQGTLDLSMVAEWGGGGITAMWERIQPLAQKEREESGRTGSYDWFEWIATMLERHGGDATRTTALQRHGTWKPPRW